ncbi:MAG: response regulator [Candidatus Thiodiazotropha sp.]
MKENFKHNLPVPFNRVLSDTAGAEFQQSVRRLLFAITISAVFLIADRFDPSPAISHAILLSVGYTGFSLALLLSFRFFTQASHARRLLTLIADQGIACLAMHSLGEQGTPLLSIMFLITLGYGVRYGSGYLYLGTLISSTGLLALTLGSPFLSGHPLLGMSLIAVNLSVSLFVSRLLKSHQTPNTPSGATRVVPPATDEVQQAQLPGEASSESSAPLKNRALIMTESLSLYQKLEQQLKVWDIACDAITTPKALNQGISANPPSLVLADLQHLTDPRAQLLISSNLAQRAHIPFILIGNHSQDQNARSLPEHDALVVDPEDQRQLFNIIHSALQGTDLPEGVSSLHHWQANREVKRQRILVADESFTTRLILRETLNKSGYEVFLAETGESAMEIFDEQDIDLAIVGRELPDLNGPEIIREHRVGYGLIRRIPFIVLTSRITESVLAECRTAGADQVMSMPLNIDELLSGITRLIQSRSASGKPKGQADPHMPAHLFADQPSYLDFETLDMLTQLSEREDFFEDLVNNFLDDVYACATRMASALSSQDIEQFREEIHAVKGAASSIGASHLLNQAIELYRLTGNEIRQQGVRCYDELNQAIEETRQALEEFVRERNLDIRIRSR